MSRLAAVSIAALLCLPAIAQAQGDPAYVDSPAGRMQGDPARADGGSVFASSLPVVRTPSDASGMPEMSGMMQTQMQAAAIAMAQAQQQQAQEAALARNGGGQQSGPTGMQMGGGGQPGNDGSGGYGMPAGYGGTPSQGAMRQIGGGLMQDAAGVLDANMRREFYGPNGPVVVPPPSGAPGLEGTAW